MSFQPKPESSVGRKLQRTLSDSEASTEYKKPDSKQPFSRSFVYSTLRRKPTKIAGDIDCSEHKSPVSSMPSFKPVTSQQHSVEHEENPEPVNKPRSSQKHITISKTPPVTHLVTKQRSMSESMLSLQKRDAKSRETQTSPNNYPERKVAKHPEYISTTTKTPPVMHVPVIVQDMRSPSPCSSITSGGTSELMKFSPFVFSPAPSGRNSSWSSLPCPSLASVTSQCDTDCLIVADATTGIIPDEISDAATDDLIEADPYARTSRTEVRDDALPDFVGCPSTEVSVPSIHL